MKILLDMDGTINDFDAQVIKEVEARGYGFDYKNYDTWNMEDFFIGSDHPRQLMDEICSQVSFWQKIQPLPYAFDVLKEINNRHEIVIVTKPWNEEPQLATVKVDWLRKHFGFLRKNEVIFTADKWELEADVIFDDKPKILEKCANKMITVKMIHPYNKDVDADFEFESWKSVPRIMKVIEKFEEYTRQKDHRILKESMEE